MKNKSIGNTDAVCPHCDQHLDKMPGRKKKCPHCGEFMFVRTRPSDKKRVLVTLNQAEQIEEQWSIVDGTHAEYLAKRNRITDEKARLAGRFGREPSENDIAWSLLNQDMMEYAAHREWGLFRNAKFKMAEVLRKEARFANALGVYLEVCYLDLNGPSNVGGMSTRELLKEFPQWDPKNNGMLAPGVLDRIIKTIRKAGTSRSDVETMFEERAAKLDKALRLPVSVRKAWGKLSKEIF